MPSYTKYSHISTPAGNIFIAITQGINSHDTFIYQFYKLKKVFIKLNVYIYKEKCCHDTFSQQFYKLILYSFKLAKEKSLSAAQWLFFIIQIRTITTIKSLKTHLSAIL